MGVEVFQCNWGSSLKSFLSAKNQEKLFLQIDDTKPDGVKVTGKGYICNEEGKMNGMSLNRAIKNENGMLMDIIAGPFFIAYAPIESEKFLSLPDNLEKKYMKKFEKPERFLRTDFGIKPVAMFTERDSFER